MITKEEFEEYCRNNDLRYRFKNKYYLENNLKINWNITDLFIVLCCYGYIETLKWLIEITKKNNETINIHKENEEAFRWSCECGQIEVVKWLFEISKENGEIINIHANDEYAFRWSCYNGCLEIAKWLIKISKKNNEIINIHANDEFTFRESCIIGNIEVAKWLCDLCDEYYVEIENNRIVKYRITNVYDKYLEENKGIRKVIKKLQLKVI